MNNFEIPKKILNSDVIPNLYKSCESYQKQDLCHVCNVFFNYRAKVIFT